MKKNNFFAIIFIFSILGAGCTPVTRNEEKEEEEWKLPEIPQEIVQSNVFLSEIFLSLEDPDILAGHILSEQGKRPVVYAVNGTKIVPGESSDIVKAALLSSSFPYFIQRGNTDISGMHGYGLLTKYPISNFDNGMTFNLPLTQIIQVHIFFRDINNKEELKSVVAERKLLLAKDAVILGFTDSKEAESIKSLCESREMGFRFDYFDIGNGRAIFSIVNISYANRGFESLKYINMNYFKVSIEKIF